MRQHWMAVGVGGAEEVAQLQKFDFFLHILQGDCLTTIQDCGRELQQSFHSMPALAMRFDVSQPRACMGRCWEFMHL